MPWHGPDFRPLALAGPLLIAGSLTGEVAAYDLATRRERWRRVPVTASIVFGIAADAHTVYVPYLAGPLIALDAGRGIERWRTDPDASGFSWKPLVVAGRLLAASSSAGFFAFRP
jgi:outer membrane protein assembly factor BamB